jgi:hypothetical protein
MVREMEMGKRVLFAGMCLLGVIVAACTPLSTDYRVKGFDLSQLAFDTFEASPDLHRVVELEKVRVHIVGSRRFFQWDKAAAEGSPTVGYSTSDNDIFLFGKKVGNKIIVNQAVLGHELNHLLSFKDAEIADPDQLDQLEYLHFVRPLPLRLQQQFMKEREP